MRIVKLLNSPQIILAWVLVWRGAPSEQLSAAYVMGNAFPTAQSSAFGAGAFFLAVHTWLNTFFPTSFQIGFSFSNDFRSSFIPPSLPSSSFLWSHQSHRINHYITSHEINAITSHPMNSIHPITSIPPHHIQLYQSHITSFPSLDIPSNQSHHITSHHINPTSHPIKSITSYQINPITAMITSHPMTSNLLTSITSSHLGIHASPGNAWLSLS